MKLFIDFYHNKYYAFISLKKKNQNDIKILKYQNETRIDIQKTLLNVIVNIM